MSARILPALFDFVVTSMCIDEPFMSATSTLKIEIRESTAGIALTEKNPSSSSPACLDRTVVRGHQSLG